MAEAIITPFAEEILRNLLHIVAEETKLAWGYKREVKRLEKRLRRTLAFLSDAESRSVRSEDMKEWLKDLKGAVNDAVVVLDEFGYEVLRQRIEVRGRFKNKVTDFFSSSHNPIAFRLNLAHKVKKVNLLLDDIKKDALGMGLKEESISALPQLVDMPSRLKPPGVDQKSAVGREKDVSTIVDQLLNSQNDEDLSVTSICGMAGLGKSHLAQLVRLDKGVASHFDETIWVSVSTDFKVTRLLSQMVESLTKANPNLSSDDALLKLLSEKLKGRRYLLILDDVWSTDPTEWDSMRAALLGIQGSMGGKVIVTCRDRKVAEAVNSSFIHSLNLLSQEDSWTLFRNKAFPKGETEETIEMTRIGKEIAGRCGGVPLALTVLGSLLRSKKSKDDWLKVLDNKMLNLEEDFGSNVHNILKLSYDHLSPSLKSCFAFMSTFPKDAELLKHFVVQLWMALGLLPPPKNSLLTLEDVGNELFNSLLEKSLLHEAETNVYGNVMSCKMHDLVHDLAQQMSEGCCFDVSDSNDVRDIPTDMMHLVLGSQEQIHHACGCFGNLQTLVLVRGALSDDLLLRLTRLRILVIDDEEVEELPSSIGKLKHLRLLNISATGISKLPDSFTKLYNLQTLLVNVLDEIPNRLENLVNLRHFNFNSEGLILIGIGKLTSLQTLPRFVVCQDKGCLVGELAGLTNLKGTLEIHGLDDVKDEEEARSAKLVDKSRIEALEFHWKGSNRGEEEGESCMVEAVLEGLRPHSSLKSLSISNFKGVKFPSWMISASDSAMKNLVEMELVGCDRCEQVPTLGHLPNLKKVVMEGLERVRKIGQEFYYGDNQNMEQEYFPALRELVLEDIEMLEEWEDVKQVYVHPSSSSPDLIHFRNLEKLVIRYCTKLIRVPTGRLSSLKDLKLVNVNPRMEVQRMSSWGLNCLTHLVLDEVNCEKGLERVIEEWFKNNTSSLVNVEIAHCNTLVELQPRSSLFNDCVALKKLEITNCSKLKVIPDVGGGIGGLAQSLRELRIYYNPEVECLPRGIETLTSLQTLDIGGFSEEVDHEIPRMPSSLRTLYLKGSWGNVVQQLPQQRLGHLSALEGLYLQFMEGLEALPEWLRNFKNLWFLLISNCKNLKEMPTPEATRHVTSLYIRNCSEILKERCVKGSGTDWPRIQHIPFIHIDGETIQNIESSSSS